MFEITSELNDRASSGSHGTLSNLLEILKEKQHKQEEISLTMLVPARAKTGNCFLITDLAIDAIICDEYGNNLELYESTERRSINAPNPVPLCRGGVLSVEFLAKNTKEDMN